jgi:hypothetical protein
MSANDVILLADMIDRDPSQTGSVASAAEQETYFTAKHYLRHYKPTHDDLMAGIVDGSQDGGLDGIYIYANRLCIRDDVPLSALGRGAQLELFILQVKNSKGFQEPAIDKMIVTLPRVLDFGRDEAHLAKTLNSKVIEVTRRFLEAYRNLEMPTLKITVAFVSLKADHLHANTLEKSTLLTHALQQCFSGCDPTVEFVDAAGLADMARDRPSTTKSLALAENPISTNTAGGYIAVVKLDEYNRFITGANGELDASLFDANVRDYEGDVTVNQSIQATLAKVDSEVDFWWLNNGVTIVANRVQPANKLLELDTPQIVNGLQTSNEIYKRSRENLEYAEERSVLVKVIQAPKDSVRDRIIQATNSQTALGPSAIRATDKVQRQIEEYLRSQGLYYERRRRQYHNQGIPADRIISIDQMGQALLSALVQTPHVARGELSRIFVKEIYDLLFAASHPIKVYGVAIALLRQNEYFLKSVRGPGSQPEDFVFHLTMLTVIALTRKNRPSAAEVASLEGMYPSEELQQRLLAIISEEYNKHAKRTGELLVDRLAKDQSLTQNILDRGRKFLLSSWK